MLQENKSLVRRIYTQVWNERNLDIIDEVLDEDFVFHNMPEGLPSGREGFKQFVNMYLNAFPDVEMTIEDILAEGDQVAVRWSAEGTHEGELMGFSPTDRSVDASGIEILRFSDGKVLESWGEFDQVGILQQIGAMPEPEAA